MEDRVKSVAQEVLDFFLSREPCRVIVIKKYREDLSVFWNELVGLILKAQEDQSENGPPTLDIKEWNISKRFSLVSYIQVRLSNRGEGLLGHNVRSLGDGRPNTMAVCSDSTLFELLHTWAQVILDESEPDCDTPTLLKKEVE